MADGFLERANRFFISKGYPSHSAAALAANAVAESGGNTRAVHDSGTGVGIYGFRDPTPGQGRKTALFDFARANSMDPYAENTQLAYAAHELDTNERAAGDKLKNAKDYKEAQVATIGYLRPHFYNPDPSKQTIPADRWNPGASVAGVEPMPGGTSTGGSGGGYTGGDPDSVVPPPNTGLLALDMSKYEQQRAQQVAAQAAAAEVAKSKEEDAAYADLQKTGMGLMQQGTGQEQQAPAPAPMRPTAMAGGDASVAPYQFITMPDFQKMLMQQRLMRKA